MCKGEGTCLTPHAGTRTGVSLDSVCLALPCSSHLTVPRRRKRNVSAGGRFQLHTVGQGCGDHVMSTQRGFPDLKNYFLLLAIKVPPHSQCVHSNEDRQQNCVHVRVQGCLWRHLCSGPEQPSTAGQVRALRSSHAARVTQHEL